MSKGRVWNKGKRNGGGGTPASSKSKAVTSTKESSTGLQPIEHVSTEISDAHSQINRVERMNRDNWVVRPARAIRKESNNEGSHGDDKS
jgi:hypothetical protein